MWNQSWSYKEGIAIGGGLLATGMLLQATVGKIEWERLASPVNLFVLLAFLILLGAMHALRRRVYLFRWLSHTAAAVCSLGWVVALTLVLGLTGFTQMLSAWYFVLLYVWMTIVLGLTVLRVGFPLRRRRIPFLLNHIGLFIVLLTATLGNSDRRCLRMTTHIGAPEWRASDEQQRVVELPLAIELHDFTIDEYPPKLILIDNVTGKPLPDGVPAHLLLEEDVTGGTLQDWELAVTQSIPEAASMATADTVRFVPFHSIGAAYAVHLWATNPSTGESAAGWVSCGSFLFPYKALRLNGNLSVVMPKREPRRFASAVTLYTESGLTKQDTIEVNRPAEIAGWKIYQLSYDEEKGCWSDISVFELVRDTWLPYVYVGIGMMILGAVCLFITAPTSRKEERA